MPSEVSTHPGRLCSPTSSGNWLPNNSGKVEVHWSFKCHSKLIHRVPPLSSPSSANGSFLDWTGSRRATLYKFSVYTSVGATTNLTQVGKHWVFNRFYNALSQTIWSSCTVADHSGILHCCAFNKGHSVQWDNLSSCFFPALKATDGKPQLHLAQQNATFTQLSCVLTVTAQVFISSCQY